MGQTTITLNILEIHIMYLPAAHFSLVRTDWFWLSLSPRC